MTSFFDLFNNFILIALPYVALFVFVIGTIWRYRSTKFKFSSLSSQFLEGKDLFWGSVPFHWGMLVLFLGHLSAFLIPRGVLAWNSHPVRLLVLEITGFIFAIAVLVGIPACAADAGTSQPASAPTASDAARARAATAARQARLAEA